MINLHWYKTAEQSADWIKRYPPIIIQNKFSSAPTHSKLTEIYFSCILRELFAYQHSPTVCATIWNTWFSECADDCCKIYLFVESYKRPLLVLVNYCHLVFLNHTCLVHCFVRKRKPCRMWQKLALKIILIFFYKAHEATLFLCGLLETCFRNHPMKNPHTKISYHYFGYDKSLNMPQKVLKSVQNIYRESTS